MTRDESQTPADQREKTRKQIQHEFVISHPSIGELACVTRDLSLSGVFIQGRFGVIVPGDTVGLAFKTSAEPPVEHKISCSVARVTVAGMGLKFLSLDMDTYGDLLDLTLQS